MVDAPPFRHRPRTRRRQSLESPQLARGSGRARRERRTANGDGDGGANGDANGEGGRRANRGGRARDAREDFVCRWDDDDDDDDDFDVHIIISLGVDDDDDEYAGKDESRRVWTPEDTEARGWKDDGDGGERGG